MKKILLIVFLFLTTYSCSLDELREKRKAARISKAQQVCSQMGFTPNTDTFRDCVSRTYNTYLLEP